jgi:putative transposase
MRFTSTVFSGLLKAIDRRQFAAAVDRHQGDRYAKTLSSWEHLVALLYGQLRVADSLRAIETGFNAERHQHYHLNVRPIARSTLADANVRRAPEMFQDVLGDLVGRLARGSRKAVKFALQMIDSTPVPLRDQFACATYNGRIKGLKLHVLFDHALSAPLRTDITASTINDVSFRHQIALEAGVTYVFDRGYCDYAWWRQIHMAQAFFVTRPKANAVWRTHHRRAIDRAGAQPDDGFRLLSDVEATVDSAGHKPKKLTTPVRLIKLKRMCGKTMTLVTNDMTRSAREIALAYKARWGIELFFKWVKQNLNLKTFLGRSENAVRIQIIVAMIAFVLIALARTAARTTLSAQRFRQLVAAHLSSRRCLQNLEKPPPINASKPSPNHPNQLAFPGFP